MLDEIKKNITLLKGKKIKVYVDIGRNKNEMYEGVILNTYLHL